MDGSQLHLTSRRIFVVLGRRRRWSVIWSDGGLSQHVVGDLSSCDDWWIRWGPWRSFLHQSVSVMDDTLLYFLVFGSSV